MPTCQRCSPSWRDEPVSELFGRVASAPFAMPVVQPDGRFGGAISKTTLLKFLDRDTPAGCRLRSPHWHRRRCTDAPPQPPCHSRI